MILRFAGALAVCALLSTVSFAQYVAIPAAGPYTAIGALPGAVPMAGLNGCDDCVEAIPLTFGFPWFGSTLTQVEVASNGAIILDGSGDNMCCGADPLTTTTPSRIAFAQEDLDPFGLNSCFYIDNGVSLLVSFELTSMYPGPASGSVEVQVEMFITGEIEIRYGAMNTVGNNIACGLSDALGQFSPDTIIPEFNAVGVTTGGVAPQNTGVRFVPAGPQFQVNSAASSLDFDGVQGGAFTPAITNGDTGGSSTVNAGSNVPATLFEILINLGPVAPGVPVTAGGQILNLNLAGALFLNGGAAPVLAPFAPFSLPVSSTVPVTVSGQMVVLNPGDPDGVTLSQGAQLDITNGVVQAGPVGDDEALAVDLVSAPSTGSGVPFCGTVYSNAFISSNGRINFVTGDGDFSPTVAEGITDSPFVGHWTDLNPTAGGVVEWISNSSGFSVTWNGVPYFGEAVGPVMSCSIDNSGTIVMDVSGVVANPLVGTGFTAGDAVFFGLSCGGGTATDPGVTPFTNGGSGTNAVATDMIYDFLDTAGMGAAGGLLPSVANLQTGAGLLTFLDLGAGSYLWTGS